MSDTSQTTPAIPDCTDRLVRLASFLRSAHGPKDIDPWTARQWADDIESLMKNADTAKDHARRLRAVAIGLRNPESAELNDERKMYLSWFLDSVAEFLIKTNVTEQQPALTQRNDT